MYKQKKAFTLVELVVITAIIGILATIAFISFSGYISNGRDTARIEDLGSMEKSLVLYNSKNSEFPIPDNLVGIIYNGDSDSVAWKQGIFGSGVIQKLENFGSYVPKDPTYENEYTYSITNNASEFELSGVVEHSENLSYGISNQANASEGLKAKVVGNYNGYILKFRNTGLNYFIASPSIITYDLNDTSVLSNINNKKLVYDKFSNLPDSYRSITDRNGGFDFNIANPVVFSGNLNDLKNSTNLYNMHLNLKNIYNTTPLNNLEKYEAILGVDGLNKLKIILERYFKINIK